MTNSNLDPSIAEVRKLLTRMAEHGDLAMLQVAPTAQSIISLINKAKQDAVLNAFQVHHKQYPDCPPKLLKQSGSK